MNKGIIQFGGNMENSQIAFGDGIKVAQKMQKNIKVIEEENKKDIEDGLEAIKRQLEDLNLRLSEHKNSLDELGKKTLILETELKEEKPNKERIKRCLTELSLIAFQTTTTTNNLLHILSAFK
jgi:chromosome segregation ATPase